jgi:hypothetical protein
MRRHRQKVFGPQPDDNPEAVDDPIELHPRLLALPIFAAFCSVSDETISASSRSNISPADKRHVSTFEAHSHIFIIMIKELCIHKRSLHRNAEESLDDVLMGRRNCSF